MWYNVFGKKENPAKAGPFTNSAFADAVFFVGKDQIIQIGDIMLHRLTSLPEQYMPEARSNTINSR